MADPRKLLCDLFGHKMPRGYGGGQPYLKLDHRSRDGTGTVHAHLTGKCPRCGRTATFAYCHMPKEQDRG